ncbi:MAG: DHHA1 domain-containing protein [Bacillota bacterium]|nr:DHHA1 domain-containing protein [Bacillota bacterium]
MENKLYYQDAYKTSFFTNLVTESTDIEGRPYVVLEKTAFFPTGGGQPNDEGTINDIMVLNVEEVVGEIRHYLESPLGKNKENVFGVIDWERRFDHMQQHAGQHILSAAFDQLFELKTIGFHLGKEIVTIDLDTEDLQEHEMREAENLANQIILENRPIETKWVTEEELNEYSLRKETKVKEDIRLVIIPDFDYNGCGGTHPHATGEIRAIKILDIEKQKKKIRVHFVCGNRVIDQLHQKQLVLLELTRLLSSPEKEMAVAVTRIIDARKELEKDLEAAKDQILEYKAKELLSSHRSQNGESIITHVYQNRTIQELQKIARLITIEDEQAVVFLVAENEGRLQVVGARGKLVETNMKNLIQETLPLINGKGGGNDSFVQGGGEALISGSELLNILLKKASIY